ncbi:LolA family protein [Acidocella sp.]|uniref:LolA family protein n=1 Tax=Acidocella sp. TaxID=50710 RepID=UPI003CFC67AB
MLSLRTKPKPPAAALPANPSCRRRSLGVAALFLAVSLSAPAWGQTAPKPLSASDKALIAQIEAYLNAQKGLTANFLQVAADGSTRTGKAWLERPGKMRFAYDPPDPQLLVAGFGILVYHDPQLGQTTNIPLSSTPLGILLAPHVNLESAGVYVTNIDRQPGQVNLTLARKGKEAAGTLTLSFSTDPLELRAWVVTDAQGKQTSVHLYDIAPGGPFPNSLFQFTPSSSPIPTGG